MCVGGEGGLKPTPHPGTHTSTVFKGQETDEDQLEYLRFSQHEQQPDDPGSPVFQDGSGPSLD